MLYTDQSCVHVHTEECSRQKETETAEGAEKTEAMVPAAADAESYGSPEPAGCSHVCSRQKQAA